MAGDLLYVTVLFVLFVAWKSIEGITLQETYVHFGVSDVLVFRKVLLGAACIGIW